MGCIPPSCCSGAMELGMGRSSKTSGGDGCLPGECLSCFDGQRSVIFLLHSVCVCVCVRMCVCVCVSLCVCVVVGMQQDVFPVNSSACTMQHKGELSHVTNMVCQVTPMNYYSRSIDSHMICNSPLCLPDSSYPPSYLLICFQSFIHGPMADNPKTLPMNPACVLCFIWRIFQA